ncbi:PREDICTED: solute carrier family 25 member 38 isoform X1 [Eufriesea mexicana]|uniref:solute carrier family 25 member 38 isoform X1 n=1 Tax=Eufriesea mexicana TaxID=516756 RepID=UPI00083C2F09|nr:PREDICTED: solute carrier family 25 member 38 isoform X1 [Eufriesea mexicana]XP_017752570.1 PREDICTED: solute carrier family 25 member 38 isoform X1 [Eufriesea mexicana]
MQGYSIDPEHGEMMIKEDYPILKSFVAGSLSGTFSTILFQPLDLVKTRLQSKVNLHLDTPKSGTLNTVIHIIKNENVLGLWRGMTPSITRVVPGVGLYFSSLHWLKHTLHLKDPLTPTEALLLGITARSMSGALLIPITVVKTRFESEIYKYNSVGEALKLIYKQEGVRGLSSGLVPTLLRDAPYSGLYLTFYTQLKNIVTETDIVCTKLSAPIHFSCGILAGIFASIVTQPADVIKTKMQLYPNEFRDVRVAVFRVYKKYGVLGYFKGIVPRMLRRTLMTAMAWTVYEEVAKFLNLPIFYY